LKGLARFAKRLFEEEEGQGMVEYSLLAFLFAGVAVGIQGPMISAIASYYQYAEEWISRPIP